MHTSQELNDLIKFIENIKRTIICFHGVTPELDSALSALECGAQYVKETAEAEIIQLLKDERRPL